MNFKTFYNNILNEELSRLDNREGYAQALEPSEGNLAKYFLNLPGNQEPVPS